MFQVKSKSEQVSCTVQKDWIRKIVRPGFIDRA